MPDNKDFLICPGCGEFMKKVYIPEAGISVDICVDGCGGLWFDNREELKFDEQHENIDTINAELAGKSFMKVDQSKDRYCPVCSSEEAVKLIKNYYTGEINDQIEIDECYRCGGKFFDHSELELMRKQFKTEEERIEAINALGASLYGVDIAKQQLKLNELKQKNEKSTLINALDPLSKWLYKKIFY